LFQTCHKCQQPFTDSDIVILNAQDEDLKHMEENIIIRKTERRSKKRSNNAGCSTDTVKEEVLSKKIKKEKLDKVQSTPIRPKKEPQDPAYVKAKEDYSVAHDPNASEVLKSIFTTHKTASEQTRAHWVTYNPFYN
jgi:hypothetical protein